MCVSFVYVTHAGFLAVFKQLSFAPAYALSRRSIRLLSTNTHLILLTMAPQKTRSSRKRQASESDSPSVHASSVAPSQTPFELSSTDSDDARPAKRKKADKRRRKGKEKHSLQEVFEANYDITNKTEAEILGRNHAVSSCSILILNPQKNRWRLGLPRAIRISYSLRRSCTARTVLSNIPSLASSTCACLFYFSMPIEPSSQTSRHLRNSCPTQYIHI